MKFPRSIEVDLDQFILKYGNIETSFFLPRTNRIHEKAYNLSAHTFLVKIQRCLFHSSSRFFTGQISKSLYLKRVGGDMFFHGSSLIYLVGKLHKYRCKVRRNCN